MKEKAQKLIEKYEELESELGNPDVLADQARYNKIHKQYKGIEKAVIKAREFLQVTKNLEECKETLGDSDPEMVAMAKEEISEIEKKLPALTDELQILMVPKDLDTEESTERTFPFMMTGVSLYFNFLEALKKYAALFSLSVAT